MTAIEMAEVLQNLLVEAMDRWNATHALDPLRKLPWSNLDSVSKQLYVERCEAFLARYDVRTKDAK